MSHERPDNAAGQSEQKNTAGAGRSDKRPESTPAMPAQNQAAGAGHIEQHDAAQAKAAPVRRVKGPESASAEEADSPKAAPVRRTRSPQAPLTRSERSGRDAAGAPAGSARNAAGAGARGEKGAEEDPQLLRMNRELNEALGGEIKPDEGRNERAASSMKALKKERRKRISIPLIFFCVFLILIGAAFGTYQHMKNSGRRSLLEHVQAEGVEITAPEDAQLSDNGSAVTYNGKTYRRNEDVISILALGIDEKSENPEEHVIGENGQADTIFIGALNTVNGEMTLINISRDSIVDVDVYSSDGQWVGIEPMQICLAYAYGDSGESSCQNMIKAVSRLMYGMPIDAYGAIDVPAIGVLNDAIGGVEVTVLDDIGSGADALVKGTKVTLKGDQVRSYVISRDLYTADANNARMARQRQYLVAFINKALAEIRKDPGTVFTLYDAVRAYMTSDLSVAKMTYLASEVVQGNFRSQDIRTVPGEITVEKGTDGLDHAAYHVDDEALYQIILDVYYTEV